MDSLRAASFRKIFSSACEAGRKKIYAESHLVSFSKTNGIPDKFACSSPAQAQVWKKQIFRNDGLFYNPKAK
jgi:hypothetical protein